VGRFERVVRRDEETQTMTRYDARDLARACGDHAIAILRRDRCWCAGTLRARQRVGGYRARDLWQ
jgi:hypothetical protein